MQILKIQKYLLKTEVNIPLKIIQYLKTFSKYSYHVNVINIFVDENLLFIVSLILRKYIEKFRLG